MRFPGFRSVGNWVRKNEVMGGLYCGCEGKESSKICKTDDDCWDFYFL